MAPVADLSCVNLAIEKSFKLRWRDNSGMALTEENRNEDDLCNLKNPPPIQTHRKTHRLKSGIKGKGMIVANPQYE